MRIIIAIVDRLANDIVGPLVIMKHEAPAIRYFGDIAGDPQTSLHRHIEDYDLVTLGHLDDDNRIQPAYATIITGAQWKAAQQAQNTDQLSLGDQR